MKVRPLPPRIEFDHGNSSKWMSKIVPFRIFDIADPYESTIDCLSTATFVTRDTANLTKWDGILSSG